MKIQVTFEIDCTRAAEVLTEAGVPDAEVYLRDGIAKATAKWIAGNLSGEWHTDPLTGLPEVIAQVTP